MVNFTSAPRWRASGVLPYVLATLLSSTATTVFAADSPVVGTISTIAGLGTQGFTGDGGPATIAQLNNPTGVAVDSAGNVYIVDYQNNRIRKVAAGTGIMTTVAGGGSGACCASGDGGQATAARLNLPVGMVIDSSGNLYIADTGNHKIRKVTAATGIITTFAGSTIGYGGDNGQATAAQLSSPYGIAIDSVGNIYIADSSNHRVRKVTAATGVITTIAGNGVAGYSGDGGQATLAQLNTPYGVAVDGAGTVYIADYNNSRIRSVNPATGVITTVAGTGSSGFLGESVAATTARIWAWGVFVDPAGNFYVVDRYNNRIRKVSIATGKIATVVGSGTQGFAGDGGPAPGAQMNEALGATFDAQGNMYVVDYWNHRIRKVSPPTLSPAFTTIAGIGVAGYSGDGGSGTLAQVSSPSGVAVDGNGNVYVADYSNNRIRRVSGSTGIITTVAGTGLAGFTGEAGPGTAARVNFPMGLAVDGAGNVYIADTFNYRIRKLTVATGIINTIAGNGTAGATGDGGPATAAQLNQPTGVAVDAAGNVFIADYWNHKIRKVAAGTGVITTVAGLGTQAFSGDGGLATIAQLNNPSGVAVDAAGNLYIADYQNVRIRKVTAATGIITTVAGGGAGPCCASGDGLAATAARFSSPWAIALDPSGNIYIGDIGNYRVRRVTVSTGLIFTVAGSGTYAFGGEGGVPTAAQITDPYGVAVAPDGSGTFYVADRDNHRVRKAALLPPSETISHGVDVDSDLKSDVVVYRPSTGLWYALRSATGFTAGSVYSLGAAGDVPVPGDYDRDGLTDIATWRPTTGVWTVLLSSSGYAATVTYAFGIASDVPVPGDYDGDAQTDVAVWRPSSGIWFILRSTTGYTASWAYQWGAGPDRPVPADYDGDDKTDIAVYRPSSGTWYVLRSSSGFTGATATNWGVRADIPVPGDYDGDGRADAAVFRPSTGTWWVQGTAVGTFSRAWGGPADRMVPADYDGDRKTDIALFRPSTGTWWVLTSTSNFSAIASYAWGVTSDVAIGSVAPYRDPTRRGDVDGDRVTDLTVYRPSNGTWYTLLSRNGFGTFHSLSWGQSGDVPVRGDYDGDALPEVAVYRPSSGSWYIALSSSGYTTYAAYQWGIGGDVPVPADYDGDGMTDVAVYRAGTWYVLTSSSGFTSYAAYGWGSPGDVPVPRDYDGDGAADVAVYRPSTGTWFVLTSGSGFTSSASYTVGGTTDVPVAGDYDGDGLTDPAVYRPSTGAWMIRMSRSNYALATYNWGVSTDTPMTGDYDGDGRTDITVFRPSLGVWYALLSSTNYASYISYTWGAGTDVPAQ